MPSNLFKNRSISIRWVLLGAGILTIIGLTAMNVYSLYTLRQTSLKTDREYQKNQLVDFSYDIRDRFYTAFYGLAKLNTDQLEKSLNKNDTFPPNFREIIHNGATDSLFTAIYFTPHNYDPCQGDRAIMKFSESKGQFIDTRQFPSLVCDGLNIARTRMKVLIDEYRWNNKLFFDTNRSMTIALINLYDHSVIGYLTFVVDQDYLLNDYLKPQIKRTFGGNNKGVMVWLMDWTRNQILAQSDPTPHLDPESADLTQRFPDLLNNWDLRMKFTSNNAVLAASETSLYRNMAILVAAGILLVGALVFMFITAQRERELANTQAGWLANVTHELKTPLAVMQAAGENLADGRVKNDERLKSYGQHIYEEAIRLRQMIEKMLDIARVDAGQVMVNPSVHQVDKLTTNYIEEHRKYIEGQGFAIDYQRKNLIPPIYIDPDSYDTIIGNLVENAMKYSPEGHYLGIHLSANDKFVKIEVCDHGVGIPSNAQKYVFDKFYRVEATLTARTKGHGLGLSIVKKLVELNDGTIAVHSEKGKGTTFTIRFPILQAGESEGYQQNGTGHQPEPDKHSGTPTEQEPSSPLKQDHSTYVG